MKKGISVLLILCTLFYSFSPIVALAIPNNAISENDKMNAESTNKQLSDEKSLDDQFNLINSTIKVDELSLDMEDKREVDNTLEKGTLEVDIKFVIPIQNVENPDIQLKLSNKSNSTTLNLNGITTMKTIDYKLGNTAGIVKVRKVDKLGEVINGVDGNELKYYAITFYNLPKDTYKIELQGLGFKTYTLDNIKIDDYSKRVSISNEKGLFEVGDINGDNKVNQSDINDYMNLLSNGNKYERKYDLNRDGVMDITDLAIIARVFNGENQKEEIKDTSFIIDSNNIELTGNIEGSIDDLIDNSGAIDIKPTNQNAEISESNPAEFSFTMTKEIEMEEIRLDVSSENIPKELEAVITDIDGKEHVYVGKINTNNVDFFTDKASNNTITIDLKGQIAVKKVTIKIKKTENNIKNLATITNVEFLNNVYEKVPEQKPTKPKGVKVDIDSEKATVTYNHMSNITGFEILVKKSGSEEGNVYQTNYTSYLIGDLKNYTEYRVAVRAVNGEWRSDYSDEVTFTPIPKRMPPMVDMLNITPVIEGFNVSYKKMDDTNSYNIYYRKKGDSEFTKISDITNNSYNLRGLKAATEYEIYVTGTNHLGEGPKSRVATGTTLEGTLPNASNYRLINRSKGSGVKSEHIENVTYVTNKYNADDIALVDNDYNTYWQADSWDLGGYNNYKNGPIITLDKAYTIDHIEIASVSGLGDIFYARINYFTESGEEKRINANVSRKTSPNGQVYFSIDFEKITTNKIQINTANYAAQGVSTMREIKLFEYDSLLDDVANLFADDLRVELKDDVTEKDIEALEKRANTKDDLNNEYHPNRQVILNDLNYAREILNDKNIQDTIIVDQSISNNKNGHLGFARSISDFQPLGVVAKADDKLVVYVGTTGKTLPQLVFTQYNAEASNWMKTVSLKKGQNIIDVPKIGSTAKEFGGSVYIKYPSNTEAGEIKVRVSGGTKIPVLDVHGITDEVAKKNIIKNYIKELSSYVDNLTNVYQEKGITYDQYNAILNSTEIVTDDGLFSVAADQVLRGIITGKGTIDEQVDRVYNSVNAFDEMMDLFYRHKGLTLNAKDPKDERPKARVNIRYMTMFDGAFMYAGGLHIGIGYGSISGLMQGRPALNTNGSIDTSGYFGWGISHEIGHQINQGKLEYAEVTNNVYALLAQTADDKDSARIEPLYKDIYKKVTSSTKGKASNVFVSLGMYWQLHLAYDNELTFSDENSIYARINHLARTTSLTGSKDDLLVMLASEASGKNLTEFFEHWGLTISDKAKEYASQYEEETRDIWYLNDDARRYRINGGTAIDGVKVSAEFTKKDSQNKKYTLSMNVDKDNNKILGYEIKRNGKVIAFTTDNTYTDNIGSMNNQALNYEVTAYDKLLNKTNTIKLEEVKVLYDGSINKDHFDITSNRKEVNEKIDYENPDMNYDVLKVNNLIDGNSETTFNGSEAITSSEKNNNPYVIINMNAKMDVAGIKYYPAKSDGKLLENTISKYNIYVSKDNDNWILAKTGTFTNNENFNTVYFDKEGSTGGNQLWTYEDITYIKIEAIGNTGISGAEFDIIAPPGDNVELEQIGILSEDYLYKDSENKDSVIKTGSVVLTGSYRGNPAFNVMLLVDAEDESTVYEGENFLFAKLPDNAPLDEIAEGTWFYVITKEQYEQLKGKNIRAELYRVNDALTNEGQRLTSTSLSFDIPDTLSDIKIVDSTKGEK